MADPDPRVTTDSPCDATRRGSRSVVSSTGSVSRWRSSTATGRCRPPIGGRSTILDRSWPSGAPAPTASRWSTSSARRSLLDALPLTRTLRTGVAEANVLLGLRRADAAFVWVLASTEPLVDPERADSTVVVCTFVDVTEQRNAQDALEASEERFRLLAENAIDVVYRFRVGPAAHLEYVNPAVRDAPRLRARRLLRRSRSSSSRCCTPPTATRALELGRDGTAKAETRAPAHDPPRRHDDVDRTPCRPGAGCAGCHPWRSRASRATSPR